MSEPASEPPAAPATPATPARRYGKRKLSDARGKFVAVRCSDAEHATMHAAAAQAGLTVGPYLRTLALGSPGLRAVRRPPVEKEALARVLGELGKLGSNVNQLSRVANTNGDMPAIERLDAIAAELATIRDAVMRSLGRGG